jgi:Coenzyme PQQ synthesis protein D (PqqD)
MVIELSDTVTAANTAVCCDLTDEVVILDLSSGVYFGLQGVGAEMWHYIQQPRTVEELVSHLVSEYDIAREDCVAKTLGFLGDLATHHLIAVNSYAAA